MLDLKHYDNRRGSGSYIHCSKLGRFSKGFELKLSSPSEAFLVKFLKLSRKLLWDYSMNVSISVSNSFPNPFHHCLVCSTMLPSYFT